MDSSKVKILFLINSLIQAGAEMQLLQLVKGLDKSRYDVSVGLLFDCHGGYEKDVLDMENVELVYFNRKRWHDFHVAARICRYLRERHIDFIHMYLTPSYFYGMITALCSPVKFRIMSHRETESQSLSFGRKIYDFMEGLLGKKAHIHITNSQAGASHLKERGFDPAKIRLIYNGIDFDRLTITEPDLRKKYGIGPERFVAGIVASLTPKKDHGTLIKALKEVAAKDPKVVLVIVGQGPLLDELQGLAREQGVFENIIWTGAKQNVADYMNMFDLGILSSKDTESCSNSILEYMYCSKPVVATDVGGNQEVVINGETGLIVQKQNPSALAQAIIELKENPRRALEMGRAGRNFVEEKFTREMMVRETEKIYQELLQS